MTPLPSPWVGLVLALGVFRIIRLVGWDAFPPVAAVRARVLRTTVDRTLTTRVAGGTTGAVVYRHGRTTLAQFVECPYCLGFWVGLAVWLVWLFAPTAILYALAPFALSAAIGIIARMLDP